MAKAVRLTSSKVETACRAPPQLRLVVKHFENRRHLPIVELRRAA
jgi:hypothetical protein